MPICKRMIHLCSVMFSRLKFSYNIINEFKKVLGADSLLLGLALPDDNLHSPNEKFDLDCFHKGAQMSALLWDKLADI